jgi:hypothetical protein
MRPRTVFGGIKLFQQSRVGSSTLASRSTFHKYKTELLTDFSNAGRQGFGPVFHVDFRRDGWIAAAKECNSFEELIAKSKNGELPKLILPKHVEAESNKSSFKI